MAKRETKSMPEPRTDALVFFRTPDGFAVGRVSVLVADVQWLTPTSVRDWTETRPKDVLLKSEKVLVDGLVTLRPTRLAKGVPIQTIVGRHVVFGELADAAVDRAKRELQKQVASEIKRAAPTWRHLCGAQRLDGLPMWVATACGSECLGCGKKERAAA